MAIHAALPPTPHDLARAWTWDPIVLLCLVAGAWIYRLGARALWRRAGAGRGIGRGQVVAFGAGLGALLVALVSPLDALAEALFSAHMAQHLVLILVAAPLLVLGSPLVAALWALPASRRRALAGWWRRAAWLRAGWAGLSAPAVVWALHTAAIWVWHLPALFEAALANGAVHALEHACFLGTALLFWWTIFDPRGRRRLGYGAGVLYVFAAAMPSGILGALMTFSGTPWYPAYWAKTAAWGLTPIEDQLLAGLIMWVPSNVVYLGFALALLAAWLRASERESIRSAEVMRRRSAPPGRLGG